jgi:peroxiredoxin Q/BCP
MPIPPAGSPAPDFALVSDSGATIRLADLRGHPVVLYFYPKDDTPGCTVEACAFRYDYGAYEKAGAVILGVSPDSIESHKFKASQPSFPAAGRRGSPRGRGLRRLGRRRSDRRER